MLPPRLRFDPAARPRSCARRFGPVSAGYRRDRSAQGQANKDRPVPEGQRRRMLLDCRPLAWRRLKNQSPHGLIHTGSGGAATLTKFRPRAQPQNVASTRGNDLPLPCDGQFEFQLIPVIHSVVGGPIGQRPRIGRFGAAVRTRTVLCMVTVLAAVLTSRKLTFG